MNDTTRAPSTWWLCLLTTLLAVLPARAARQATFESEYATARKEAVTQLLAFAEWCSSNKLLAERDQALESVLAFDAANETAHKTLKHAKQRDGTWAVPERKNAAKNANPAAMEECAQKRGVIATALRERGLALIEFYEKKVTPELEQRVLADVLLIDPADAVAHEKRGEVELDGNWVLRETAAGKGRRVELKAKIQELIAAVPAPAPCELTERERGFGIDWKQMLATPLIARPESDAKPGDSKHGGTTAAGAKRGKVPRTSPTTVRVIGTCSPEEARKCAVMCHAAADVFRAVTGAENDLPPDFTVYLLTNPTDRDTFISKWPGWNDDDRAALRNWAGTGMPKNEPHVARWDIDEAKRLDGAVRHTLGLMTLWNFDFDHRQAAWIWEGFGLYLTRELVGTRFTWYGSGPTTGDPDAKELLGKLMLSDVNWMNECYQRAKRGKAQPLAKLFERKIDQLGVDDVLLSYAFSAYLVEGCADRLPLVFRDLHAKGSSAAVSAALGIELPSLDARLVRWLSERK